MASKVDVTQLEALRERIARFDKYEGRAFCIEMSNELAGRFIRSVKLKTPVGHYTDGRQGGTLRRGWSMDNTTAHDVGKVYTVTVENPVSYAEYVEYGHLAGTKHPTWVLGRFMASKTEDTIRKIGPKIIKARLDERLMEVLK